jgi:glycosyltransferase involved in cell wall biosynthesis
MTTGWPIRVVFALVVIAGNRTRYLSLRPVIDADPSIDARWITMRTYEDDDRWRWMPRFLRPRVRNLWNLVQLVFSRSDAIVIHAFETYVHYGFVHWLLRRKRLLMTFYDGSYRADGSMEFGDGIPEPQPGLAGKLRQITLDETDLFIPWSHFTAGRTVRAYPPAGDRVVVLHPGIDLGAWPRRTTPAPHDELRLLFVGGDGPRKGLDTVIDALELGIVGPWVLDVVTSPVETPGELRARLDRIPTVRVHDGLTSGSPGLRQLYDDADVFVLPTRLDLSSLASIEAMATGVPVVTSNVGGLADIVIDEHTGLVVPPDDARALATAIERLRLDPSLAARLADAGRAHVEAHFDSRHNGIALVDIVKQMVADPAAAALTSIPPAPSASG